MRCATEPDRQFQSESVGCLMMMMMIIINAGYRLCLMMICAGFQIGTFGVGTNEGGRVRASLVPVWMSSSVSVREERPNFNTVIHVSFCNGLVLGPDYCMCLYVGGRYSTCTDHVGRYCRYM